jgi:NAD(P)-dependent dehydrogenase (short-subunit alcohol dehydrogenase family)
VALVTAGASGIGKAIVERLLENHFQIHIADISADSIEHFTSSKPGLTV